MIADPLMKVKKIFMRQRKAVSECFNRGPIERASGSWTSDLIEWREFLTMMQSLSKC